MPEKGLFLRARKEGKKRDSEMRKMGDGALHDAQLAEMTEDNGIECMANTSMERGRSSS